MIDGKPLHGLKVVELKEWLQRKGIKTSGKRKTDLINKRCIYMIMSN